jgi:F-type H+-transporting ATPase subunit a
LPYLLTVFFFILTCNLLGLIPWSATATSIISVTAGLALIALFMIQLGGIRQHGLVHHAKNLVPPGIPLWLLPIMIPVELLGQLTKPFALCIRLYANMTAGHLVILSFLALIFVMKTLVIAPVAIGFALFINILEVFIAFLQAYIFTMLTSLFMGMTIHPEH